MAIKRSILFPTDTNTGFTSLLVLRQAPITSPSLSLTYSYAPLEFANNTYSLYLPSFLS